MRGKAFWAQSPRHSRIRIHFVHSHVYRDTNYFRHEQKKILILSDALSLSPKIVICDRKDFYFAYTMRQAVSIAKMEHDVVALVKFR